MAVSVGNITTNTWSAMTPVSGTDYAPPNVQTLEVRAISRPSALASWTPPQTISAGFLPNGASIDSAAVNASGNGVVVFDAVDAAGDVRWIFATTF